MKNWITRRRARTLGVVLVIASLATAAGCVAPLATTSASGAVEVITSATAESIALDQYPGATVVKTELVDEDGASFYSVELQVASGEFEVRIDPNSGAILAADAVTDTDNDQTENVQEGDLAHAD